jgi:hypothetical protein
LASIARQKQQVYTESRAVWNVQTLVAASTLSGALTGTLARRCRPKASHRRPEALDPADFPVRQRLEGISSVLEMSASAVIEA